MNYYSRSFRTKSYWIYALWSVDSGKTFMAALGSIWLIVEILSTFKVFNKEHLTLIYSIPITLIGLICVIVTRRPVKRIIYKYPGQDLKIEVCIDDIFNVSGQKIISTNTTFDTDIANGIISPSSLQGQFTQRFFSSELAKLDTELNKELKNLPYATITKQGGKTKRYNLGTTVKLKVAGDVFYWFAMADLNHNNNAKTTLKNVQEALDGLWEFIETKGEKQTTVIPLIGTGLGRLATSRKKLIAIVAQSFINASENHIFSEKLIIVVHPTDLEKSGLNLFEVKDLLNHYLP